MRLAFSRSYVVLVRTQRCATTSRIERENASKRSRALATFGSITRSKTRCRSYNASSFPANGIGPLPYCLRRSEASLVLVFAGTRFGESSGTVLFVLIEHPCRRNYLISVSFKSTAESALIEEQGRLTRKGDDRHSKVGSPAEKDCARTRPRSGSPCSAANIFPHILDLAQATGRQKRE